MELLNGREPSELFNAQAHIWKHMLNMMNPFTLKCAIQLGIPDTIHNNGAPMTIDELVKALEVNKSKTQHLWRLMRILTHYGFFIKEKKAGSQGEEDCYKLAPPSQLLLKDEPLTVRPYLPDILDPFLGQHLYRFSEWYKTDDTTAFQTEHGKNVWDFLENEQTLGDAFNEGMAGDARLVSGALIKDCKDVFQNLTSIVDVGGGTGVMMKAISAAFPQLQCISYDRPHVIAGQEGTKNLSFAAGDMFESIPSANAEGREMKKHGLNFSLKLDLVAMRSLTNSD